MAQQEQLALEDVIYEQFHMEPVTIFLSNGVKLGGTITRVFPKCCGLSRDGVTQLVMYSAIATIMPQNGDVLRAYNSGSDSCAHATEAGQ